LDKTSTAVCPAKKTSNPIIKFSFMTQTMDLNNLELAPMDEVEMQEVDGGL